MELQTKAEAGRTRERATSTSEEDPTYQQRSKYTSRWHQAKAHTGGPWDFKRALETYQTFGFAFDRDRFSEDEPLVWEAVPWPVANLPPVSVKTIDWGAVEEFFTRARQTMARRSFRQVVEKSLFRFHIDRWRARGMLKTVADEKERKWLENGMIYMGISL
ncbi:hypothetical protein V5O48_003089 [Marasmius crinis-equi]|uniref:Uncharacterized protein n=1 Tax=Marasmius crinis-equi TaxID=585013 RepID=A0ABR3FTU1_9AGAR